MNNLQDRERIAILETKVESLQELLSEVKALREDVTRYKGFIGGVAFVFSCLVTFAMLSKDWLLKKFGM